MIDSPITKEPAQKAKIRMARKPSSDDRRVRISSSALTLEIAPTCGACLTRCELRIGSNRYDILRPAVESQIQARSPYGASCFPMIPYAGRLREGTFEFAGRSVRFPINAPGERHSYHGDGWMRPWNVLEASRGRVVLELPADATAPIHYHAIRSIEVEGTRWAVTLNIRNCETTPLPLGGGLHPYFPRRQGATLLAQLPLRWRLDSEQMPLGTEPNPQATALAHGLPVTMLPAGALYSGWDGTALISWPAEGIALSVRTRPAVEHAVVWVPDNEDFFCFEPVSHATNSVNLRREQIEGEDHQVIGPGEIWQQEFIFTVSA